jgi:hypothetical protein
MIFSHEGHDACHYCKEVVCGYCRGSIGDNILFCLSYLVTESIVPAHGSIGIRTILEMQAELKDVFHFGSVKELESDEVEDAYASLLSVPNYHMDKEDVRFSLYPLLEIDSSVKTKWEELLHINFNDGVAFIHDPELATEYVPGVLNFFEALTTFTSGKETGWKNQKSIYAGLPSIKIQFASDWRVDLWDTGC